MKKVLALVMALLMVLSLAACGESGVKTEESHTEESHEEIFIPTKESVVEGIKYEFKDPDSVQISEGDWAYVEKEKYGEVDYTQCYIIATVRAKNSFGGYAEPENYIIHYRNGKYSIEGKYVGDLSYDQRKFEELGCDARKGLK